MREQQSPLAIRPACCDDLDAIKHIADANRDSLGFVVRAALAEHILREWLYVAFADGLLVGFANFRPRRDGWTIIYEICVTEPSRRKGIGCRLLSTVYAADIQHGRLGLQLKCPVDSPANAFYDTMGLQRIGEAQGKRRNLVIWQWKRVRRCIL
jgi:GNAT superfamily N-acetyltransferase